MFNNLKIEVSRTPDVTLFTRFQKNSLAQTHNTTDQTLSGFDASSVSEEGNWFIKTWRHDVLTVARSELDMQGGDYKEFANLCLVLLGDGNASQSFTFNDQENCTKH